MRFNFAIPAADIPIANAPEIGSEKHFFLSYETLSRIGEVFQPAAGSGTWTQNIPAFEFPNEGVDLQLICANGIRSAVPVEVVFAVTLADNTETTAKATFVIPTWVKDQSANLPQGIGRDLVPQGVGNADKKIKAVTGFNSILGGSPGNKFILASLPSNWFPVGCTEEINPVYPVPTPVSIPCGSNPGAFTKNGRGEPGSIEINSLAFSYMDGVNRLNGHVGSALIEVRKDNRVISERIVITGLRMKSDTPRPDGDERVVVNATGAFEDFAIFV